MNNSEKKVIERVALAINALTEATDELDSIKKEDRTPQVDHIICTAADNIYDAKRLLGSIDLSMYDSGWPAEHIKPRLYNKRKYIKVASSETSKQ